MNEMKATADTAALHSLKLAARASELFAGLPPYVVGPALADLLAMWLANHHPTLREKLLEIHINSVRAMLHPNDSILRGKHPEETREWPEVSE